MKINIPVRLKNKAFWIALIPALLLVIQLIFSIFGIDLDFGDVGNKLLKLIDAIFALMAILGIVTDPTTDGFKDSNRAMSYTEPYKDGEE